MIGKQELSAHPVRHVAKPTTAQKKVFGSEYSKWTASSEQKPDRRESESTTGHTEQYKRKCPACGPDFNLETPHLHSGNTLSRSETTTTTQLPPILEDVWQQSPETTVNNSKLDNIENNFAIETTQET